MPGYSYARSSFAGWIWNRTRAVESLGRAYNYPHQTAVYHSMYRLLRDNDLLPSQRPALWYLRQAAFTIQVGIAPEDSICTCLLQHPPLNMSYDTCSGCDDVPSC